MSCTVGDSGVYSCVPCYVMGQNKLISSHLSAEYLKLCCRKTVTDVGIGNEKDRPRKIASKQCGGRRFGGQMRGGLCGSPFVV